MKRFALVVALLALLAVPCFAQTAQGTVTTSYNVVTPAKPAIALANLGAGNVDGAVKYKITLLDAAGETLPSAATDSLTAATATNGKVLVTIPAFVTNQTGANVYRQEGGAGDYKLVNAAPITEAGVYTDNIVSGSLGAAAPTANTAGLAQAADLVVALANLGAGNVNGVVSYKYTFVDAGGETLPATASANVTGVPATNGKVNVTIPALPVGATGANLYRTAGGGATYYQLASLLPAGVYVDNIADINLGVGEPPVANTTTTPLTDPVDAPTVALANLGAGGVTSGTHSYKLQWNDTVGHSLQSANKSNVVTTVEATNGKVNVTIPAFPAGAVSANIFRTVAGDAGNYLLVNATPILAAGVYVDNIADGSLGAAVVATNTSGLATPAVPTVALANLGAGLCTDGAHTVKVAYVTASGISTLSPASDAVTTASATNGKIVLTVVASPNPSVTSVNAYMNKAGGSTWYLAASGIANSNGTTTLSIADASLTSAAPSTDTSGDDTLLNSTALSGQYMVWIYNHDSSLPLYFSLNGSTVSTSTSAYIPANSVLALPYPVWVAGGGVRVRSTTAGVSVSYVLSSK